MENSKPTQKTILLDNVDEIKTVFEKITTSKTQICLIAPNWGISANPPKYFDSSWILKLAQNKQIVYAILNADFLGEEKKVPEIFKIRYTQSSIVFPSTILIFEDKVLLITNEKDPVGALFNGKETAENYRQYFTLLWESSQTGQTMEKTQEKFKNKRRFVTNSFLFL